MKKNKSIIFIAFGTSYVNSYEQGIFPFIKEAKERFGNDYNIELCFTSKKVVSEIREGNIPIKIKTLEEISEIEYEEVIIYPLYLIEGREFGKVKEWSKTLKCNKILLKE
ncbi:MAG: sirohydrochlorin cobaltochelatase, partial [Clostridium sp.]